MSKTDICVAALICLVVALVVATTMRALREREPAPAAPLPVQVRLLSPSDLANVFTVSDGAECWLVVSRPNEGLALAKTQHVVCERMTAIEH